MFGIVIKDRNTCTRGIVLAPTTANKNTRETCVLKKSMRDATRLKKLNDRRDAKETMRRVNLKEKFGKPPSMSVSIVDTDTESDAASTSVTPSTTETKVFFDGAKMYQQLAERMSMSIYDACGVERGDVPRLESVFEVNFGKTTVAARFARKLRTTEAMLQLALDTIRLTCFADDKVVAVEKRTKACNVSKLAIAVLESADHDDHEDELVTKEVDFCIDYVVDLLERKAYVASLTV
ncbi:hypothetical protein JKP88DRAFT_287037 [Tribonema minus]|uniref:Uncharacterized protein n=1 Tax=Tribonema minus TaxID=303371 RepID=A0A835ZAP6_9STRA|nr:hypothetical protein JKP88DRAFT_287037 [Tribonema minus]